MLRSVSFTLPPLDPQDPYTHVEVARGSTYHRITTPQPEGPALPRARKGKLGGESPELPLGGLGLPLVLTGQTHTITFTGGTINLDAAASQIMQQCPLLLAEVSLGRLYLTGRITGPYESLRSIESDAASLLQLPMEETRWGTQGNPLLNGVQPRYVVKDPDANGDPYRWRLVGPGVEGGWSPPFFLSTVPAPNVVEAVCTLRDGQGQPVGGAKVSVRPVGEFHLPLQGDPWVIETDFNGEAKCNLIRGHRYQVQIGGSLSVREVLAPLDPTVETFDLFGASFGQDADPYQIQVPDLSGVYVRRSL